MPHALAPVVEAENDAQELELGGEQGEAQALCNDREDGGGEAEGVGGSGSGGGWGERRAQLLQLGAASWDRLVPRRVRRIFGQGIMPRAWGSQGPIFGLVDRQTTPASAWEWCVLVRWLRLVDTWKSRRVGRLDFLRHPLVRPVVQLPTEAFVGLLFWTSLMAFVRSVYWFMLAAQGLTSHILLLGYLLVPGLVLGHEFLHQLLSTNPVLRALLVLGGVVGVGGSREGVETTIWGVALSGAGVAMVGLYIGEGLWLAPPARRRRVGFGLAGGLLLLQALQLAFGGRNPLLARWWGLLLLAVLPGAWVAALLLYEELRDWEGEEEEGRRMVGGSGSAEGAQGYWPAGRGGQRLEGTVLSEDDWSVESEGGWRAAEEAGLKQWDSVNVLNEGGVKSGERCMEMVGDGQERAELRAANASFVAVTVERAQEEMQQQQQQMGQQQREVIPASVKAQAAEPAAARPFSTGSGCLGTSSEPNSQGWGGSVDESHDASSSAYDRSRTVSASAAAGAGGNAATGPVWVADMLGGFMEEEEEVENGGEGGTVVMSESDNDSNAGASGVACACHSPHGCECIGVLCAEGTLGGKCNSEVEERGVPVERAAVREGEGRECTGYGGKAGAEVQGNGESGRQGAAGHDSEEQIEGHGPEQQDGRCSEGTPKCNEGSLEGNEGYPEWREPARGVLGYFGLEIGSVETSEGKLRAEWRSSRQWETTVELSECDSEGRRGDLAVRTEWWRLGRLAWGSGVPDRMALLALLLILLLLLPFPLLLQYAYAPSSSPTFVSSFGSSSSSSSSTSSGSSGSAEPGSEAWVQLRVLNFNVQQGFSRAGSVNLDAIEHVIWQQKPDIVLLQESDTMHMIHGNVDMVQYLATWLGMHAWSAPPARHQSWGCAILSRFPLLSASPSQSLPSPHGELACFQHAVILLGAGNMLPGGGNMVTNRGAAGWGNQTSGVVSGYPVHIMNAHFSDLEVDIRLEAERAASLVRSVLQAGKGGEHGAGGEGEKEDKAEREERRTQEVGFPRGMGTAGELSGGLAGDFNLPPLSPPYLSLLAPGLVDSEAERMGAWKSMGDRDPGAGYVFVSRGNVECEAWAEPRYDQRKTSDGYPVVVDVRVTLPAAAV
ncbi:unnamed protein product [Closterium sp. NIES-64]|nr:unnamed protein product [Closterium sp. NIES-64]